MQHSQMPSWIRVKIPPAGALSHTKSVLSAFGLSTVCEGALCPNTGECFSRGTVTFMILGDICTRNCPFCAVAKGKPLPADPDEPRKIAEAVKTLRLKHVVITSVDRDDLKDHGANHFAFTILEIRMRTTHVTIEVLIPDFQGSMLAINTVIRAKPDIINHNIETIPRIHPYIKPKSLYLQSLELLKRAKILAPTMYTKSGLMVGLGETREEVVSVMQDLRDVDCDMLTIGQYLKPPDSRLEVKEYITPEVFEWYKKVAEGMGFLYVASAPLVRSSYYAAEAGLKVLRG